MDKLSIYFSYLTLKSLEIKYHLVNVDSENFNLLIPDNYKIDYSKSVNDYIDRGNIFFYNTKSNFELNYVKIDYDIFKEQLSRRESTNEFKNYRDQHFYEIVNENQDKLYMYFNGYKFKVSTNHKFNITELFDMYFILFSVTNTLIQENYNLIRELTVLKNNGVASFCNDKDLTQEDLTHIYDNDVVIEESSVVIENDDEYLNYKDIQYKVNQLSSTNGELSLVNNLNAWEIDGSYNFEYLGKYFSGIVLGYNEIESSTELTLKEKENMLTQIVVTKQNEMTNYYDKIKYEFYIFLIKFLKSNITYDIWNKCHLREFIFIESLYFDNNSVDELTTYNLFVNELDKIDIDNFKYDSIKYLFNTKWIKKNIKGESIIIYPDSFDLSFSGLNNLFDCIEINIDENYNISLNK